MKTEVYWRPIGDNLYELLITTPSFNGGRALILGGIVALLCTVVNYIGLEQYTLWRAVTEGGVWGLMQVGILGILHWADATWSARQRRLEMRRADAEESNP